MCIYIYRGSGCRAVGFRGLYKNAFSYSGFAGLGLKAFSSACSFWEQVFQAEILSANQKTFNPRP